MKKLASILFAILISTVAFGQDRGQSSPEERAKKYTDRLTEQLDLTAEQQKKFYEMSLEDGKANWELRTDRNANRETMKNRMKERQQKLEAILTPEQLSKYKALRSEQMNKRRDDFKRKPGMKKKDSLDVMKKSVL